jgi:hypothetical protein
MSTKINRKKFTELLRTLIKKEIKEASTTATAGGEYDTPNAFQSKGNEKRKKIAKTGTDFKVVEAKWAVTVDGVGKIIIDASGAGQAKTMVGRSLKKGMKGIVKVQRVQSAFGKQIDKKTESVVEGRLSSYQKKAILIAIQMSGNMTNAVKKIERIKKGLSNDKKVKDALRLANESITESDLGLTYKRGKTVKVKHKSSGKRLVIVDKPAVRKEYEKIGYFAESIKEARYTQYRNDDTLSPRQKIGRSMREVRNSLSGLSKLIDMNVKLKNELKIDSKTYWKNTHKAMSKISERLVKLANKVGKLQ